MRPPALAVVLVALALPGAARAATVGIYVPPCQEEQSKYGQCYPDEARFKAAPGEPNDLTITAGSTSVPGGVSYTFHDGGAPVQADRTCQQIDEHTAKCSSMTLVPIVDVGDGDDKVEGPGQINGGAGNDVLTGSLLNGGPGDDQLTGTDQTDVLIGGPGHDTISAGAGNDTIEDGGDSPERDVIDGGSGTDLLAYDGREDSLDVSLSAPGANEDQVTGVENLRGGDGNDLLFGDAGPNTIDGGAGNDIVNGQAGNDILSGGIGSDVVLGGTGNDTLDPGDAQQLNSVDCGAGIDKVEPTRTAVIHSSCEFVDLDQILIPGRLRLNLPARGGLAPVATWSRPSCLDRPCSLTLTVTGTTHSLSRKLFGAAHSVVRSRSTGLPRRLVLRLNAAGRRAIHGGRHPQARVRIALDDGGDRSAQTFLVRL